MTLEAGNRKLIRPSLTDVKDVKEPRRAPAKKQVPPEQTNAENFYYIKQMQSKTPMILVMRDGEQLEGVIEWYDRCSIKFNREDAPNLLIYKANIKYLYKKE